MNRNYKIGLALGSGAARGLAHIGVIETLQKYNIPIDMVSGSSAGALIGGLFCCGFDFKYVKGLARELNQKDYVDVTVPRKGLIKGEKIEKMLKLVTKDCEFKDLNIPLIVAATDLKNKKVRMINEGKLYEAIRASISIPGVFIPYFKDDMTLVDGGILERVPAGILKESGMDIVIGVDVGFNMQTSNCKNIFHVFYESMDLMAREIFSLKKQDADIMIRVDLNDMDPTRFDQVDMCVEKGIKATKEAIPLINELIEKWNFKNEKIAE